MKNLILLLFLILVSLNVFSQEPLKHEPKVYVNPNGKVFINKSQPVYFRVSLSADPGAPSYVLPSEKTTAYANPMYLDTEGNNTLRSPSAIDKVTKKQVLPKMDVLFNVYADGIAPVSNLKITNSKRFISKINTFYCAGIKTEIQTTDVTSGIEKTYISVNGSPFIEYNSNSNIFETEQSYIVKYYSVDNVGNAETPKSTKFQVDISAPKTNYKIIGENKGKVLSSKASIGLYSSDTLSGIDKIWYSINDGPFNVYTSPIPIMVLKNENSKITYYATDKVGNKEESKVIATSTGPMDNENTGSSTYSFYIDKEPPQIGFEIEGDQFKGNYLYLSERSRFKVIANDDKSGVEKISYSIDNLTLKNTFNDAFSMPSPGLHSVAYAATDYVGNAALVKTQSIFVDVTIPSSLASYQGTMFSNRDTIFITQNTLIQIKVSDSGSGIKNINYSIDQGNEEIYKTPVKIEDEGFHTLKYHAVDQVNNTEKWKVAQFFVDNTAPHIITNFSTKAIGEKIIRDEKYTIYPSNVMLYIAATDNASGCEKIEYKINGNAQWQNSNPIKGFLPGNYDIVINTYDVLKNKSTTTIRFAIEN